MGEDSGLAVIIDTGSGLCKAGFASEDAPRCVFPTVVGRPRKTAVFLGVRRTQVYVGAEAQTRRGVLNLKSPVERGIVTNWEDLDRVWTHVFEDELRISPSEHPVLLTETPLAPGTDRNLMAEIMFEGFEVPAMHVESQAVLAMYACNCTTGVVLDTGDGVTHAVPVHKGVAIPEAIQTSNVAGAELTEQLMRILNEQGYSFTTSSERQIIRDMKERLAYVALDFDQEMTASKTSSVKKLYTLPDGEVVTVNNEMFRCTEPLFTPSIVGSKSAGLPALIFDAIMNCKEKIYAELFANIHITGGNSLLPGLVDRIQQELITMAPCDVDIHVEVPEDRQYVAWLGGSIMASVPVSDYMWLTKAQYAEHGRYHYGCYDPISPSTFSKSKVPSITADPIQGGDDLMRALKEKLSTTGSAKSDPDTTPAGEEEAAAGDARPQSEHADESPHPKTESSKANADGSESPENPSSGSQESPKTEPPKVESVEKQPNTDNRSSTNRKSFFWSKDRAAEKNRDLCVVQ